MDAKRIGAAIVSAAASVGTVLGLFGSVLTELVPPSIDDSQVTKFVSLGVTVLLLIICAVAPSKLSPRGAIWVGAGAIVLLLSAFLVYFVHRSDIGTYVYRYPPGAPVAEQKRHIRGEYHDGGARMAAGLSPAAAVARAGGPGKAEDFELLWRTSSKTYVENRLVLQYELLVALATAALFVAAFAAISRRGKQ